MLPSLHGSQARYEHLSALFCAVRNHLSAIPGSARAVEKDKQPVCDIGKRLMLDTNTITPLLQRMEKAGLIVRTRGTEDTRQRIVSLTPKGMELQEQMVNIPDCLSARITDKIGSVDEIVAMIPTLDKLIEGLSKIQK